MEFKNKIDRCIAEDFVESQYYIQVSSVADFEFLCNYCEELGKDINHSTSDRYNCKEFPYITYHHHGLHGNSNPGGLTKPWIAFSDWLGILAGETEIEESEYNIEFLWN